MNKVFIVANWKSYKTTSEADAWLQRFKIQDLGFTNKEVIVCPSYTLLTDLKSYLLNHKSSIKLGAQNISPFDEGAYTGEVAGQQIKEFAEYVLVGHSERRKNFNEHEDIIQKKLEMADKYKLTPILCVSSLAQISNLKAQSYSSKLKDFGVKMIIAYEPLFAIGSGKSDTPENANEMAETIKAIYPKETHVLYGGSVTPENVGQFIQMPNINGVLVGGASLDPDTFAQIIKNA